MIARATKKQTAAQILVNGCAVEASYPYASFRDRYLVLEKRDLRGQEENKPPSSPIIPHRKLAQNRRCSTRRAAPSRHAMSGARYSNHLHAEEAAGSLEALIRDYESRGRRLRVRTTTSAPNVLPIHHPACLRPARLVNRRCCKRGTRCTVSARRLAAPTPASPLSRLHRRHRRRHRRHRRRHRRHRRHRRCYPTITGTSTSHLRTLVFPPWQHPDLAVFFDEALAASGDEVRSLC